MIASISKRGLVTLLELRYLMGVSTCMPPVDIHGQTKTNGPDLKLFLNATDRARQSSKVYISLKVEKKYRQINKLCIF